MRTKERFKVLVEFLGVTLDANFVRVPCGYVSSILPHKANSCFSLALEMLVLGRWGSEVSIEFFCCGFDCSRSVRLVRYLDGERYVLDLEMAFDGSVRLILSGDGVDKFFEFLALIGMKRIFLFGLDNIDRTNFGRRIRGY
ncbi:MAG: hypothetical protein LBE12_06000 [Planctomycetaceae bacterium]|jgi:hypothetical protein|nr:hypothetical protein [Planctomycetaceae bacterium]